MMSLAPPLDVPPLGVLLLGVLALGVLPLGVLALGVPPFPQETRESDIAAARARAIIFFMIRDPPCFQKFFVPGLFLA